MHGQNNLTFPTNEVKLSRGILHQNDTVKEECFMREYEEWDPGIGGFATEKEEKKYASAVWVILLVIFGFSLFLTFYVHSKELNVKKNANMAMATKGNGSLYVVDEDGVKVFLNTSELIYSGKGETIPVYYFDSLRDAKPLTWWAYWCVCYAFFGVITGVSLYKLIKIYLPGKRIPT